MYLYLAGDIGGYKTPQSLTDTLTWDRLGIRAEDRLVLLGDNMYPKGIPPAHDPDFPEMAARLRGILTHSLEFFTAPIYILPGNHDYNRGHSRGIHHWQSQQQWLKSFFGQETVVTQDGSPLLYKTDTVSFILLDTQFYLQPDLRNQEKHLEQLTHHLDQLLKACVGTPTVLCGHHPIYSRAMHGGKFSLREHLFPLSMMKRKLLVPLPGLGSALALGRRTLGAREDIRHPRYRRLRKTLQMLFSGYNNLVYVAGHDHNLQHYGLFGNHFLISGSASKTAYVRAGGRADFVSRSLGCFRVGGAEYVRIQALDFNGKIFKEWPLEPLKLVQKPAHPAPKA